jgi:cell filamentation protein
MKYYPPSNHIYYEGSDIPINKFNIKDTILIHELEKEQLIKAYELLHNDNYLRDYEDESKRDEL